MINLIGAGGFVRPLYWEKSMFSRLLACLALLAIFTHRLPADDAAPIRIVTLGDSITRGVRGGVKKEQTFAAMLEASLKAKGVKVEVVNVGIGGERADQALARLDKVIALKPALVTIMYGTNDSYVDKGKKAPRISKYEYAKHLRDIVDKLKAAGIQPVLMTEPRWGDGARNGANEDPNVRLEDYLKACRAVAKEARVPLVDHYLHWSRARSKGTDIAKWTTDLCHPNEAGHREINRILLPVILKAVQAKR